MITEIEMMMSKIANTQERFHWISDKSEELLLQPELLSIAMEELSITLEELAVQQEELAVQQEELIESRAEIELQRQKYQDLFEFAPDAYITTDTKGVIQEVNQKAQDLFNMSSPSILGKPLILLVKKEDYQAFHTKLDELCHQKISNTQLEDWEIHFKARNGKAFPAAIAVSSIFNSQNQIIGLRWVIRDITAQKEAEKALIKAKEEAEAANKAKDYFLANISHELRTPLTSIIGFVQLLLKGKLPPKQRQWIEQIDYSSQQLLHLIDKILNLVKISSSKIIFKENNFYIRNLVQAIIGQFTPQIIEKNLTLSSVIDSQIPEIIKGDQEKIEEIINNLISNAIKFTEEGEIKVSVTLADEQPPSTQTDNNQIKLQFAIKDTGIGIMNDCSDLIFQRFSQVDNSWTRQYSGSGLGLAIAKELCQQMGGEIWVESEINKGSTFYFTIITQIAQGQKLENIEILNDELLNHEAELQKTSSMNILVVDDDPGIGTLIILILQQLGYQADLVTNPFTVIETVTNKYYNLIFMDLQMPGLDGLEITRQIRQQWGNTINYSSYPPPQVIALTANNTPEIDEICQQAGMNGYLSKPFNINIFESFFKENKF